MTDDRRIRKVFKSRATLEGAGVHLRRVFGNSEVPLFDSFLMLDDFRNTDPALPQRLPLATRSSATARPCSSGTGTG